MTKAEKFVRLGRAYYQGLTDSAGYPNGMPYWADMSVADKRWYCCEASVVLEGFKRAGLADDPDIASLEQNSLEDWSNFHAEVDKVLEATQKSERDELERRIAAVRGMLEPPPES